MKEMVRRKLKRLLVMNVKNWVTYEVSAPNSSLRTKEQGIGRRLSKLHGMTPLNPKGKRNKKKWPTFASWLLKATARYHLLVILLLMIVMNIVMMMIIIMMMGALL